MQLQRTLLLESIVHLLYALSEPMHYTYRSCLAVETHVMKLCSHSVSGELATFTAHDALQISAVVL